MTKKKEDRNALPKGARPSKVVVSRKSQEEDTASHKSAMANNRRDPNPIFLALFLYSAQRFSQISPSLD